MYLHVIYLYNVLPLFLSPLSLSLPPHAAIASAVSHWQELKAQGKLDHVEEEEEEDIYAAAARGAQVHSSPSCLTTNRSFLL